MKNKEIISNMTLEDKATLCSGSDYWHTVAFEKYGIPSITVSDGPHGLRKQKDKNKGLNPMGKSYPATCYPTAATVACSWDRDLIFEMGQALGSECVDQGVDILLGPGVNMKRSPLCGRNFEYYSEDPYLAGQLAAKFISGVQSCGIGTSLKHFACNSQESRRMTIDEVVDERALREIYLPAFENAVKESQPYTVMNSYNRINGVHGAENHYLQTEILRDEWGFEGFVVSDWGAVNDRVAGIAAGNDLEMPNSGGYNTEKIINAVKDGSLKEEDLDLCVDRILTIIFKTQNDIKKSVKCDMDKNHLTARKIAGQSMVLLKNDNNILPLKANSKIGVIGSMAKTPRYQGEGSSLINPTKIDSAVEELEKLGFEVSYAEGYNRKTCKVTPKLLNQALTVAKENENVILFIGLPESFEAESYDRKHINLPDEFNMLVDKISEVNKNLTVVLFGGAPSALPWFEKVPAVLNAYLGGQATAGAVADILSGKVNPSGKLTETYPLCTEDNPSYNYYIGGSNSVVHKESIYIGYRYYNTFKKDVRFPFGYGLSYSSFEYSDISVSSNNIKDTDTVTVSCKVTNTSDIPGSEIIQLYVSDIESDIFRPSEELKDFCKIHLEPQETKEVSFTLSKRAFAYYNVDISDWHVQSGEFNILIGSNSRDLPLSTQITVKSSAESVRVPDFKNTLPSYYNGSIHNISDEEYELLLGRKLPPRDLPSDLTLTISNCIEDAHGNKTGKKVIKLIEVLTGSGDNDFAASIAKQTPIRNFISMSMGVFSVKMADGLLMILSGNKPFRGFLKILSGIGNAIKKLPALLRSI